MNTIHHGGIPPQPSTKDLQVVSNNLHKRIRQAEVPDEVRDTAHRLIPFALANGYHHVFWNQDRKEIEFDSDHNGGILIYPNP